MKTHDMEALAKEVYSLLKKTEDTNDVRTGAQFVILNQTTGTVVPIVWTEDTTYLNRLVIRADKMEFIQRFQFAQEMVVRNGSITMVIVTPTVDVDYWSRKVIRLSTNLRHRPAIYLEYALCFIDICPFDGQLSGWVCSGYMNIMFVSNAEQMIEAFHTYIKKKFNKHAKEFRKNREKLVVEWDHYQSIDWRKNEK